MASSEIRARNWRYIVYQDSAPDNWQSILDGYQIQWAESPLHDKDVNDDGTPKKAHWHIVLRFAGNKSLSQIRGLLSPLNGPPVVLVADDLRGAVRYLAHLDHSKKFPYPVSDIKSHGGFDLSPYLDMSQDEKLKCVRDMVMFIRDNNITEFQDLLEIAANTHFSDWFPILCSNPTVALIQCIKGQRFRTGVNPHD